MLSSHATRNYASEFLKDRHPRDSSSFPKSAEPGEIARAHGKREVPKLLENIALEWLDNIQRATCLRYLLGSLSQQERKHEAVQHQCTEPLVYCVRSRSAHVRTLTCSCIASVSLVRDGRHLVLNTEGLLDVVASLIHDSDAETRTAASDCLRCLTRFADGVSALLQSNVPAIAHAVALLHHHLGPQNAKEECLALLADVSATDDGIAACLHHNMPDVIIRCVSVTQAHVTEVKLASRCLKLVCQSSHGKVQAYEAGGASWLAYALRSHNTAVLSNATAACMAMAVEKSAKLDIANECGVDLGALLNFTSADSVSESQVIQKNAKLALQLAAELTEARKFIASRYLSMPLTNHS